MTLLIEREERNLSRLEVAELTPAGSKGMRWREVRTTTLVDGSGVSFVLNGVPGQETVLLIREVGQEGYSLVGPFRWPSLSDVRHVSLERRRTLRGIRPTSVTADTSIEWLPGAGKIREVWPRCFDIDARTWECLGVLWDDAGVVLFPGAERIGFAVAAEGPAPHREVEELPTDAAVWGRLICLERGLVSEEALRDVSWSAWRSSPSPHRPHSIRIPFTHDPRVTIWRVTGSAFWVTGPGPAEQTLLQIQGAHIATERVSLADHLLTPPENPVFITLSEPVVASGRVLAADGQPAPGSLVLVSEVLEDDPDVVMLRDLGEQTLRRREFDRVTADPDGRFVVPALGRQRYEFLAMHPTLGRAGRILVPDGHPLIIRLTPSKQARGRVLRDHRPVGGLHVFAVPGLTEFAASLDPLEHIALDAVTGSDGWFSVSLPASGSGEIRVGSSEDVVVRRRYANVKSLPAITELGDIELGSPFHVTVILPGWDSCELHAIGPVTSAGMQIIVSTVVTTGVRHLSLPEAGRWWLTVLCGGREMTIDSPFIDIPADSAETTVTISIPPSVPRDLE